MSQSTEILHCELGNHKWDRERKRGVKPRNCPDHQPVIETTEAPQQKLTCAAGHEWTRPPQRGKPPRYCPEHSAHVASTITTANGDVTVNRNFPTLDTLLVQYPNMDSETVYKLRYIETVLPHREGDDLNYTLETQRRIIATLKRTQLTAVPSAD